MSHNRKVKTDANQGEIVEFLEAHGVEVIPTQGVGAQIQRLESKIMEMQRKIDLLEGQNIDKPLHQYINENLSSVNSKSHIDLLERTKLSRLPSLSPKSKIIDTPITDIPFPAKNENSGNLDRLANFFKNR